MRNSTKTLAAARRRLSFLVSDEGGQAVLEYILMVSVAVSVVMVIGTGFRRILIKLWEKMARDIAAPCPSCPPPPDVRIR